MLKIISGGQTGVDRAALDAAQLLGLPLGGWCPAGRRAEDGRIAARYPLMETPTPRYSQRTRWNVRDSDATLILSMGPPQGGTALTVVACQGNQRPYRVVDLADPRSMTHAQVQTIRRWLRHNAVRTLNVAGPRSSKEPEAYWRARQYLTLMLAGFLPS